MTRAHAAVLQSLADMVGMINGGVVIPEVLQRSQSVLEQALAQQFRLKESIRYVGLRTTCMVNTVTMDRNGRPSTEDL